MSSTSDESETSTPKIDLGTNIDLAEETSTEKPENPAVSDDMFFSTISDPEPKKQEDMDEMFRLNKPMNEVNLDEPGEVNDNNNDDDDDDPFSFSNNKPNIGAKNEKSIHEPTTVTPDVKIETRQESNNESLINNTKYSNLTESISSPPQLFTQNIEQDDEEKDKYLEIRLSEPHKIGDGMGSYMVYKISVKTNIGVFKSKEFTTNRRFSDFLSLFEKLKEKHLPSGRILPPVPEKDMIGMAKVKMSKDTETTPIDFLEKRRAALERFLQRLAAHKSFRYDPDFRDFLEISEDLPKANNTSALSGAGMLKMFKSVTDSVTKIAVKMEETDQLSEKLSFYLLQSLCVSGIEFFDEECEWFEEKARQIDNLYLQYKKLHSVAEYLYTWRKDLAASTKEFSKTTAFLSNIEEQLNLSRALSHLGEAYEKIDQIYLEQANSDYFLFAELVKDYVCLFDNIKEVFFQRIKMFGNWQRAEETLKAKKESKTKFELSNKLDKVPAIMAEINEWESKVTKAKEEFELISKNIKEEVRSFDLNRAAEFKTQLTKYLETLLHNQETIVKVWEQYLPEVKAI